MLETTWSGTSVSFGTRGAEGATVQKEVKHLRFLLFRKKKHPVTQDIWIPAASPGDLMQPFLQTGDGSTQTVAHNQEPRQDLTR